MVTAREYAPCTDSDVSDFRVAIAICALLRACKTCDPLWWWTISFVAATGWHLFDTQTTKMLVSIFHVFKNLHNLNCQNIENRSKHARNGPETSQTPRNFLRVRQKRSNFPEFLIRMNNLHCSQRFYFADMMLMRLSIMFWFLKQSGQWSVQEVQLCDQPRQAKA